MTMITLTALLAKTTPLVPGRAPLPRLELWCHEHESTEMAAAAVLSVLAQLLEQVSDVTAVEFVVDGLSQGVLSTASMRALVEEFQDEPDTFIRKQGREGREVAIEAVAEGHLYRVPPTLPRTRGGLLGHEPRMRSTQPRRRSPMRSVEALPGEGAGGDEEGSVGSDEPSVGRDDDDVSNEPRQIAAWLAERPAGDERALDVGEAYTLLMRIGRAPEHNILRGDDVAIPDHDVPEEGLALRWELVSNAVEFRAIDSEVDVRRVAHEDGTTTWVARFDLHVPRHGDSATGQVGIVPLVEGPARIDVDITARRQVAHSSDPDSTRTTSLDLYRQFTIELAVGHGVDTAVLSRDNDEIHADLPHMNIPTSHEWATPQQRLELKVHEGTVLIAFSNGSPGSVEEAEESWPARRPAVKGPIERVQLAAQLFGSRWGKRYVPELGDDPGVYAGLNPDIHAGQYLNTIDAGELLERLMALATQGSRWPTPGPSSAHVELWDRAARSKEMREMAFYGRSLFDAFFPRDSLMRQHILAMAPESLLHMVYQQDRSTDWVPHVPWGLMYTGSTPSEGEPVDPQQFLGLRLRLAYSARPTTGPRDLGLLDSTFRSHLMYWADDGGTEAYEAEEQRELWSSWTNQRFYPDPANDQEAKAQIVAQLQNPSPHPVNVLYLYCHCLLDDAGYPILQFANTSGEQDVVTALDVGINDAFSSSPFVFANACETGQADTYQVNQLEQLFFNRGCRAFLGSEAKLPAEMAARFATTFFAFFYRKVDPEIISIGEAIHQARKFLWEEYRNVGGLFYSLVNSYELYIASAEELAELPR